MRHGVPGSFRTELLEYFCKAVLLVEPGHSFLQGHQTDCLKASLKRSHLNLDGTADHRRAEVFVLKCKDPKGSSTNSFKLINSEAKLLFVSYSAIPF